MLSAMATWKLATQSGCLGLSALQTTVVELKGKVNGGFGDDLVSLGSLVFSCSRNLSWCQAGVDLGGLKRVTRMGPSLSGLL
jgi:hypothetical protein